MGDKAKENPDLAPDGSVDLEDLAKLRRWIFRAQMNHLKAKLKGETPEVKQERKQLELQRPRLF